MPESELLRQEFELGYTYTRSTGPIVGAFLGALREHKILGSRGDDGTVYVPPMEYDPVTASELRELVEVADCGQVVSWCWVKEPRASHPLQQPFAWAMVKLDGADVAMVHALDAAAEADVHTGMRVQARWAETTRGHISDISCFVAEGSLGVAGQVAPQAGLEPITGMDAPVYLKYRFTAGEATARFLAGVKSGVLRGQRCPGCNNVYVPPRGSCAACGVATTEEVEVADKATVESFTIVWIPIPNNPIKPPYVIANLVVDGANISFIHLLSECVNEDVHIGQRVQAVWKPAEEWSYAMDNIRYFKPIDEADVPIAKIGHMPVTGWEA